MYIYYRRHFLPLLHYLLCTVIGLAVQHKKSSYFETNTCTDSGVLKNSLRNHLIDMNRY